MTIVIANQSILDIAIQEDGSVLAAFDWAIKNGISVTDDIAPGLKLNAPNSTNRVDKIADYFLGKRQNIATKGNLIEEDNYEFPEGDFPISL